LCPGRSLRQIFEGMGSDDNSKRLGAAIEAHSWLTRGRQAPPVI
jgi:hypothetical protein